MPKLEWDGLPQYRVLQAIRDLRNKHIYATSPRIASIIKRSVDNTAHMLLYFWDKGYVRRMPMRRRKVKLPEGKCHRETQKCSFEYALNKKGEDRLEYLKIRWGSLDKHPLPPNSGQHTQEKPQAKPQCCLTLPSDRLPSLSLTPGQPSTMTVTPGAGGK